MLAAPAEPRPRWWALAASTQRREGGLRAAELSIFVLVLLWPTSSPVLPGDVGASWVKVDLYLLNHVRYNCGKLARRVMAPAHQRLFLCNGTLKYVSRRNDSRLHFSRFSSGRATGPRAVVWRERRVVHENQAALAHPIHNIWRL